MSTIPFPITTGVPIIGQPTIREVFVSAVINCACASKHALLLSGFNNVAGCPDCATRWALQPMPNGQIGVARVVPRDEPPA